jgi:hypothetical protein
MAKRFTDSEKWKKPFIKKLPMQYKLLWFYLLDDCNHAGVWQVDLEIALEIASLRIGYNLNLKDCINALNEKIKVFDNGEKWFIKDFVEFQYGELNEKNRAHNSVITVLKKYNLLSLNKPLVSPLQEAKDKDKDKDKEVLRVFDETSFENLERIFKTNKIEIRKKLEEFLEVEKITPTFRNKQIGEILKHFRNWLNYNTNNSAPWVSK